MIPDVEVDLNDELEWMMIENNRITEEVAYLRNKMIEFFGKPVYTVEMSQPKLKLCTEIIKYVEELSNRIKEFAETHNI